MYSLDQAVNEVVAIYFIYYTNLYSHPSGYTNIGDSI